MANQSTPPQDDDDEYEGLIPVNSRDEIPANMTEAEAADFWYTHCLGPGMLSEVRRGPFPHGVFSVHGLTPPRRVKSE